MLTGIYEDFCQYNEQEAGVIQEPVSEKFGGIAEEARKPSLLQAIAPS